MHELELLPLLMGLLGGLAVFLFGMEQMTDALKSVAGSGMSKVLGKLTKNRIMACARGRALDRGSGAGRRVDRRLS